MYLFLLLLIGTVLAVSPDWYPTPQVGTLEANDRWRSAFNRSLHLLAQLSVPEKVNITTGSGLGSGICVGNTGGVPRLGIKGLCLDNGPLGISQTSHVTVFPCGIAMGATFDRRLVYNRGTALGRESKRKGIDVHLGPVVGPLGRHATGGRNWEGFTNEPYLAGKLAAEAILGVQGENVMATIKHLIGNEQEHFRKLGEWQTFGFANLKSQLSSNIADRTLNEVYLWPFGDSVKAGAAAAMCSYQLVNGTQACQNSALINGKLKSELGFQGFLMSDWLAQESGVSNALAGLDMSMPGNEINGKVLWGEELTRMVVNGTLPESRLDDMVLRILTATFYLGVDDDREPNFSYFTTDIMGNPNPLPVYHNNFTERLVNYQIDTRDAFSSGVALEAAKAAVVLLQNDGTLPLKEKKNIGVFGVGSQIGPKGAVCKNMACSDGALTVGWGSGSAYPTEYQSPFEALRRRALQDNVRVTGTTESWNMALPRAIAQKSDVNIVYVLSTSGEADAVLDGNYGDRNNVSLWHNGDQLINTVASEGNTVVVVTTVGAVDLEPWINHPNVSAVVLTGPAGDYGGEAMASVLFGDHNPSGKLPYTIAKNVSDYIPIVSQVPPDGLPQANFNEGIFIDYKWFDRHNKTPRFEFGYGLSYSNFSFSDLDVTVGKVDEQLPAPPAPVNVEKLAAVRNTTQDLYMPVGFKPLDGIVYPWLKNDSTSGYSNVSASHQPFQKVDIRNSSTYHFANGSGVPSGAAGGIGGNPALWETAVKVSHLTTNNGPFSGSVVSQLYVSFPQSDLESPKVQLRGFDKSPILQNGESHVTSYELQWRDLAVWDVVIQNWRVQRGEYRLFVGHSSRQFVLSDGFVLG